MNFRILPLTLALVAGFSSTVHAQSLTSLFDTARSYDATFKAAQWQYTANLAKAEQSKALNLPTVNLTSNLNRTNVDLVAASNTVSSQSMTTSMTA